MVPSGPPTPIGGSSSISPALLRSNSAILGSQGGSTPPQGTYSSLVSPRGQYNVNVLANSPSVSSLLHQTFGNGGSSYSLSGLGGFQRGSIDPMAESNTISMVTNDAGFTPSFAPSNMVNSGSSGQVHIQQIPNLSGNASLSDQQRSLIQQKFQHVQHSLQQFPVSHNQAPQQPQSQSIRGGMGAMAPVKLEPQVGSDQIGPPQKLQKLHSLGRVKVEPQQNQIGRGMTSVKIENQHSDQASFLQQQQRQQQLLQMSKQPSQATIAQLNYLQQQRLFQLQQQQQQQQQKQQLLRTLPQQQPQVHQQFEQQNFPVRSAARPGCEPGTCARRLTQYMYQQQHRPNDNNIEFWRKFVAEFFAPNARKRWCFSLYGNSRQTGGVFPQDLWCCGICNRKPSRGFETTVEVLPRLFKIKYDSGTLEELLYVDMPREYQNQGGQIVLDYAKATQESVFEHLRVVRDGQLRIVFSPDLKICSWEFCARRHEELIPRRLIIPQVSQLGAAAQKYQACAQNASSNSSTPDLESNCNMFLASARQLAKALEVPLVNDLGYTKRYVRCLQISEVVNSMKDLIDCSRMLGKGPMESLAKFSLRARPLSGSHGPADQLEDQHPQITGNSMNNDHHSTQASLLQPSTSSGVASANSSHGTMSTTTSATDITGLLRQSSMNSRIENGNNPGSPYTGTLGQIPSAGSSTTPPQAQLNPSSPFSSATPSSPNNAPQSSSNMATASATANHVNTANSPAQISMQQQSSLSNEGDPNESQSSVEKILQEIMSSSQYSGISADSEGNNTGDMLEPTKRSQKAFSGSNCLTGSAVGNNNNSPAGGVFENLGSLNGLSAATTGARGSLGNNSGALNGRISMPLMHQGAGMTNQKQELATRFMNEFGPVNGFFDHQFN